MSYFDGARLVAQGYLGSWNCFGGGTEEGVEGGVVQQQSCLSKYTYGIVKTSGELPLCLATTAFCVSGVWCICAVETGGAIGSFALAGGTVYSWRDLRHLKGYDEQNTRFEGNNQDFEDNIGGLVAAVKSVQEMDRSLTQGVEDLAANNEVAAENNQTLQEKINEMSTFVQQLFETKKAIKEDRDATVLIRDTLQAEVVRIKALVKQMMANANATRAVHEDISGEVDEFDENNEELEANVTKLVAFQGTLSGTYQRIKEERQALATEVDQLQETESGLNLGVKNLKEVRKNFSATEKKLEETQVQLAEALSKLDSLKELEDLMPALTRLANTAPPVAPSSSSSDNEEDVEEDT
jgi:chromosome segregation ATPase